MVQRVQGQIHALIDGQAEQLLLSDTDVATAAARMVALGNALMAYNADQGGPPGFHAWLLFSPRGPSDQRLIPLNVLWGAKVEPAELGTYQVRSGGFLIDYSMTEQQANDLVAVIQACTAAAPLQW